MTDKTPEELREEASTLLARAQEAEQAARAATREAERQARQLTEDRAWELFRYTLVPVCRKVVAELRKVGFNNATFTVGPDVKRYPLFDTGKLMGTDKYTPVEFETTAGIMYSFHGGSTPPSNFRITVGRRGGARFPVNKKREFNYSGIAKRASRCALDEQARDDAFAKRNAEYKRNEQNRQSNAVLAHRVRTAYDLGEYSGAIRVSPSLTVSNAVVITVDFSSGSVNEVQAKNLITALRGAGVK